MWAGKIKVSIQTLQYINGKRDPTPPEYKQFNKISPEERLNPCHHQ